ADSSAFVGASPLTLISLACALDCQLSFVATVAPVESYNSSVGSAIAPMTPAPVNDGPMARKIILFGSGPPTINPQIRTSSFTPTFARVEMFARRPELGLGSAYAYGGMHIKPTVTNNGRSCRKDAMRAKRMARSRRR